MTDFEDYKNTGAANLAAPPTGAPEGMARTDVNNVLREVMAVTRRDWEGTASGGGPWRNVSDAFAVTHGGGLTVKIAAVNQTALFPLGRKVKVVHASSPDAYGFVSLVAMSGSDTIVTVEDFDGGVEVQSDCDGILIFNAFGGTAEHGLGRAAFEAGVNGAVVPSAATGTAINTAVALAISEDGYCLLEGKTYEIDVPITLETGMKLIGMGTQNTILKLANNVDDSVFLGTAADRSNIEMRGFSIDGNKNFQSAGNGIHVTQSLTNVWLDNIEIKLTKQSGITIDPAAGKTISQFKMTNCDITSCGRHCFELLDDTDALATTNRNILINNCSFTIPQGDGSGFGACVRIRGHANISNVYCDPGNLGAVPIGITFLAGAAGGGTFEAGGDPPGGFQSVLTNFVIREDSGFGSVATAIGLNIAGRDVSCTNGVVQLIGASAKPLQITAQEIAPLAAPASSVSNCTFVGGDKCEIAGAGGTTIFGQRSRVFGCKFRGQASTGLVIQGKDSMIRDCLFESQVNGLTIGSFADRTSIEGCQFKNCTGKGLQVSGGAIGTLISGNSFLDISGNAIDVLDPTAVNTAIIHNYFNSTGTDIVDLGTTTHIHLLATLGQAPLNTWTTSNVVTDRSIDANGSASAIADGLCTLIEDLKTLGVLG